MHKKLHQTVLHIFVSPFTCTAVRLSYNNWRQMQCRQKLQNFVGNLRYSDVLASAPGLGRCRCFRFTIFTIYLLCFATTILLLQERCIHICKYRGCIDIKEYRYNNKSKEQEIQYSLSKYSFFTFVLGFPFPFWERLTDLI